MTLIQKILELVEDDLISIEKELTLNLDPYLDIVSNIAGHILFSGGKRLRPLLMVLSSRLCGYSGKNEYIYSTVFEYLHTATLLHDDIIDEAAVRRSLPVAHSIWPLSATILTGDFLLAKALEIAARTGLMPIINLAAKVTSDMSQGEIHQMLNKRKLDITENDYINVIKRKTASLIQAACETGAILADSGDIKQKALSSYGENIGIAFQIADDLLDYTSESKILGKEIGTDLREGKITLPLIHTLKNADHESKKIIEEIILNEKFSYIEFENLIKIINKYNGITYSINMAKKYILDAKKSLNIFEDSKTKDIMLMVADYIIQRKK